MVEKLKRKQEKAVEKTKDKSDKANKEGEQDDSDSSSMNLSSESEDSDKMAAEDADALNAQFVNKDDKVRTDVRNLR